MNLPDVNVWLALTLSEHTHHPMALTWLDGVENGDGLCFCRATQQGMLRLLTTAEVMARYGNPPLTNRAAWQVYEQFLEDERITFVNEPEGLEGIWKMLASRGTNSPKLWMDAYLAAFARCSGLQLVTIDEAFSQFKGLNAVVLKAK